MKLGGPTSARGRVPIQRLKGDLKRATAILNRARAQGDDLTDDLEQAVLAAQRLLAAAVALSSPIRRGRIEQKVSRQGAEAATLPMYERLYCAPADIPHQFTHHYIGSLGGDGAPDSPTEPIHQSNCQIERTGTDIAAAVRMETGRRLTTELRFVRHRYLRHWDVYSIVRLDPRPLDSDDLLFRKPMEAGSFGSPLFAQWFQETVRDGPSCGLLSHQPHLSDLSDSRMHLALEYGFNVEDPRTTDYPIMSDDPRELRCDDRGHIEALDRWTEAEW